MRHLKVKIPWEMPGRNKQENTARSNTFAAAKLKKQHTEASRWCFFNKGEIETPVTVKCTWHRKTRREDPDNISAGIKYILDGAVAAGVIKNDGWNSISRIEHAFKISRKACVYVTLITEK